MYILTLHSGTFLTFKSLKDFNRYSKKWLSHNFKNTINSDQSERLKIFDINFILKTESPGFHLYYKEEK